MVSRLSQFNAALAQLDASLGGGAAIGVDFRSQQRANPLVQVAQAQGAPVQTDAGPPPPSSLQAGRAPRFRGEPTNPLLNLDAVVPTFQDQVARNPRGSGNSPLPFDPTGAEVRNFERPRDRLQDSLAEGVLTAGTILAPGPKVPGVLRRLGPVGGPTAAGAGIGTAAGGVAALSDENIELGDALQVGFGAGAITGFAGAKGLQGVRAGRRAVGDALDARRRANAPLRTVPSVSNSALTQAELDAIDAALANPSTRAIKGRKGFPTREELEAILRDARSRLVGNTPPEVNPFALPPTRGQQQFNSVSDVLARDSSVRDDLIRDAIAKALRDQGTF